MQEKNKYVGKITISDRDMFIYLKTLLPNKHIDQ